MLGDKVIIMDYHRHLADQVYPHIKDKTGIIGISGESGTGKTELAEILRSRFYKDGIGSLIISLDNYYKTSWKNRRKVREETKEVGLSEINFHHLNWCFYCYKNKGVIPHDRINKFTGGIDSIHTKTKDVDVILLEGLYAIHSEHCDYRIFLKETYHKTEFFRKLRKKEKIDDHRRWVLEEEHKAVQSLKGKADLVI